MTVTDTGTRTATRTADEAAIRAVLDDSYKAWADGDADGMVADYAADATAIMPGSLRGSRETIRASMSEAFAGPLKNTSIRSKELSLRLLGDDTAIVVQQAAIIFPGQDAAAAGAAAVNATWVLARRGGSWQIAAYHNSPVRA